MVIPVDTYRGIDNWVCYCHNSPLYRMLGKARAIRRECGVELRRDEVILLHSVEWRDRKWYVTAAGDLLENQGVWSDLPAPVDRPQRVADKDLTFFVHMYITLLDPPSLLDLSHDRASGEAIFVDRPAVRIWLKRSMIAPHGLDSRTRRTTDPRPYRRGGRMYEYVRTFSYHPLQIEVMKAEYDWLAAKADRAFNELVIEHTGVKDGVVSL